MHNIVHRAAAPAVALTLALGATSVLAFPAVSAQETPAEETADQATGAITDVTSAAQIPNALTTGETPVWYDIAEEDDRVDEILVYSAAMDREIPVALIPATDGAGTRVENAPTLYLLNGAGGAEQNNDWLTLNPTSGDRQGTIDFYSGKGVNVVIPMAGAFSYYLDWESSPNTAYLPGPQKWETFLTQELPGPVEERLGADDRRGIIGFSMSATSAVLFAEHNPGFYDAVAGFSGHYGTAGPVNYAMHGLTLQRGGATPEQMLGRMNGPHNLYNDAIVNAEGLRGAELYFSNGSGLAGETDMLSYYTRQGVDPLVAGISVLDLQVQGGIIEGATNASTHDLKAKLDSLGIPADWKFRSTGTHSWPSWRADVQDSWPTFQRAFFPAG